ncbi:MAG: hypothetical protein ACXWMO_04810 [Syntrophales bacterium]
MMRQTRELETVDNILQNPTLGSGSMIDETPHRFEARNPDASGLFNSRNIQEIVKNYLDTLSDAMRKEAQEKKIKTDIRSFSHFTLPEWVR